MSATASPARGVRLHPNGTSWQVRVYPFPPVAGFASVLEANDYAQELRKLKRAGVLVAPEPEHVLRLTPLSTIANEHLDRLAAVGGKYGRPYSPAGLENARKAARPWTGETVDGTTPAVDAAGRPFASLPLQALGVRDVERYLERRALEAPRQAVAEYQSLRSILRLAARRGESFDLGLLALEGVRRRKRAKRHVPTLAELEFLAARAPEWIRRIILLGSTLGCRISELLYAEDAWLDLEAGTFTIPEWVTKQRRETVIDLLESEVKLFREQRLARSADTAVGVGGTLLLFPRKRGTSWTYHSSFWNRVVVPTRTAAAEAWRKEHGLAEDASTPFDGFAPHDLRRAAATLLLELGLEPELAAARLGHKDAGHLLLTTYAEARRSRLKAALEAVDAEGGVEARLAARGLS